MYSLTNRAYMKKVVLVLSQFINLKGCYEVNKQLRERTGVYSRYSRPRQEGPVLSCSYFNRRCLCGLPARSLE